MRRLEVGPDAAPARGRRTLLPLPGGAGAPPGGTTAPCEELADGGPLRPARGSDRAMTRKASRIPHRRQGATVPESAARRRSENAACGAPRGATCRKRYVITCERRAAWRAIPSIFRGGGREDGLPGAAKNTGGLARPYLSHAGRRGGIKTNRELPCGILFGYIRALFRSG